MAPQAVTNFLAILLVGGLAGIAATIIPAVRSQLRSSALWLAAIVALASTAGSLYLSDIANFDPCQLCWFQRTAMYPLAVIVGLAALRRDDGVRQHALPLASVGLALALYHVQLQAFPDQGSFCSAEHPCTSSPITALGFLTIPQMSALAFAAIIGLLLLVPTNPPGAHHAAKEEHDDTNHGDSFHALR